MSIPRRVLVAASLIAFSLNAGAALAQDAPKDPAPPAGAAKGDVAAAREAWAAFLVAREAIGPAVETKDPAKVDAAHAAARAARDRFVAVFRTADWDAFDTTKEAEMVGMGLQRLLVEAVRKDHDAKLAVRVCEALVAKFGDTPAGRQTAAETLPRAYLMAGDIPRAVSLWEKQAAGTDATFRNSALVALGDVYAAQGDLEKARATWARVGSDGGVAPRFKSEVGLRTALLGKPAPEIDSKEWLGGEPAALSSLRGKVVVVDFWGTWCRPCIEVMPAVDALYRARKDRGLVVLGVTRFFGDRPGGFLPKGGGADPLEGAEPVKGLTAETFPAHLKEFRQRMGSTYPYVTTASDAEAKAYGLYAFPTMVVIGRDGNVAFVQVGGGDDSLLRTAVDRLLAAPAGETPTEK